jgi:aerobic carbon-monoxide dehydrogenase large subunit
MLGSPHLLRRPQHSEVARKTQARGGAAVDRKHIGKGYTGLNNRELAAGRGTFVNDIQLPGMAYLVVLRSVYAHARIVSIDVSAAEAVDGVLKIMTGEEAKRVFNPIPEGWNTAEVGAKHVDWYPLVPERVRYVGEAVAAVVAESKHQAQLASRLIEVRYEALSPVADPEAAMLPDATLVEPDWGDNLLTTRDWTTGDVGEAFRTAGRVASGRVRSQRITGVSIEPRGVVASFDPRHGTLEFWESTQNPHPLRTFLAETLSMPESKIHVIQPNVGGGFGLKQPPFQEEPLVAHMSRVLGRPVKWIEERDENFQATGHSRDVLFTYEVAFGDDGTISGLRTKVIADVGAPTALLGWGQSFVTGYCLPGVYRIPNTRIELFVVVTNKCPWNSYRGFGKDSASFLMDRVIDHVARETGLPRLEVRSRNFIPPDAFPYSQPSGAVLDSGDYQQVMARLLELADIGGFPEQQRQALAEGRRLGLGIGQELTPEGCAMPGAVMISAYDGATVRVAPSGEVTVLTGVTSPGCGNETAMAQIAADTLGCEFSRISVIQGDTDICPYGLGNYSSRATMYGGSAVQLSAGDLRDKLFRVAAKMLEADSGDIVGRDGVLSVVGAPGRSVRFDDVVNQIYRYPFGAFAEDEEPGLEATRYFRMGNIYHQPEKQGRFSNYPAWPNGLAACVVEVDEETGYVKILRWFLVEDAGTIINPLLADANLHGAIAQGIGGAMYERISYADDGQLMTATLMDYTIPTAVELPLFDIRHVQTPSPFTPLGMKGIGESGVGSALGALCSAVENAFPELDLSIDELTLTPSRVWRAIRDARASARRPVGAG